jgi:glucose-fructose oxidoreductase
VLLAGFGDVKVMKNGHLAAMFTIATMAVGRLQRFLDNRCCLPKHYGEPMRNFFFLNSVLLFALHALPPASCQNAPSQNRTPLRVAIVGLVHGHVHGFLDHSLRNPEIEIVGIAEPDRSLASQYASQYKLQPNLMFSSLDEMLEHTHPQAVLVYTNTYDHRRVVETCAHYGVHVMMEKPLAVSLEDALAIKKAADAARIQVLVNYETTWYPSNRAAYNLVHENALGSIRKVVVHDGHSGPKEIGVGPEFLSWLTDPKLNGAGALFDFGCYGADLMTWLMNGQRPETVTAVTQRIKPDIYPHVDDEATIILTYPKAQAIVQASWNWPFDRKDMEVYGQTGYVITVKRDDIRVRHAGGMEETMQAKAIPAPYDDSLSFLRAVLLDGLEPDGPSSLDTNVTVTEILDAARRSAATGTIIPLPASR